MPTTTSNYGFVKPDLNQTGWGGLMNTNLDAIDSALHDLSESEGSGSGSTGPTGPAGPTGSQGPPGATPTIVIGTVTALPPGSTPTVVNVGTDVALILNFGIPSGSGGGDTGPDSTFALSDTADGNVYLLSMVDGNITVTLGTSGTSTAALTLSDTTNGLAYSITTVDGDLTVTEASSSGAVSGLTLADSSNGHTYTLTTVGGALTATTAS